MYFFAAIAGLTAGTIVWCTASHWIAVFTTRVEGRRPELVASKRWRAVEAVICGGLFVACLVVAFWIMRLLRIQMK